MAHGVSQVQSQLQAFLERARLGRLQSQPVQLPLSQAFLAQGQSGQSQSSKERVSLYPLQVWQALDLSERLLLPAARMLLLLGMLGLERLVRLRSRVRQLPQSLALKARGVLDQLRLQVLRLWFLQAWQLQERLVSSISGGLLTQAKHQVIQVYQRVRHQVTQVYQRAKHQVIRVYQRVRHQVTQACQLARLQIGKRLRNGA